MLAVCEKDESSRNDFRVEVEPLKAVEPVEINTTTTVTIKEKKDFESNASHGTVSDSYLTLTGTIKRSKKSRQQETDVQITVRKEDLEETSSLDHDPKSRACSVIQGIFTFFLAVLSAPFVFVVSSFYSFYVGSITWHNVFSIYSEEESLCYRITIPPLLMIVYPPYIIVCSMGVGVYSAVTQILCNFSLWLKEIQDLEKGFYGWLCRQLSIEDCCPYELVILTQVRGL